jgi:UDP-N-acetylmuramate-alanine ligase
MSSVAMILHTYGLKVSGGTANPGTLNKWLTNNGGYAS